MLVKLVILVFVLINKAVAGLNNSPQPQQCRTPDDQGGWCLLILDCPPMLTALEKEPKPISPITLEFLESYECGSDASNNPLVCCPSNSSIDISRSSPHSRNMRQHVNAKFLPSQCGSPLVSNRISHGKKTEPFEFPWMALLGFRFNDTNPVRFFCGGTIINEWYILTAAHCIENTSKSMLLVRIGEYNITSQEDCSPEDPDVCFPYQDLEVDEVIVHPFYRFEHLRNDIGLVRVRQKMKIEGLEHISAICLPLENIDLNKNGTVTGWGLTEKGNTSSILLKATLPVSSLETCRSHYKNYGVRIGYRQFCAGGHNKTDACAGDSGSPFQFTTRLNYSEDNNLNYVQLGIVSFGLKNNCGGGGSPSVFTNVAYYMKWILDNIRDGHSEVRN